MIRRTNGSSSSRAPPSDCIVLLVEHRAGGPGPLQPRSSVVDRFSSELLKLIPPKIMSISRFSRPWCCEHSFSRFLRDNVHKPLLPLFSLHSSPCPVCRALDTQQGFGQEWHRTDHSQDEDADHGIIGKRKRKKRQGTGRSSSSIGSKRRGHEKQQQHQEQAGIQQVAEGAEELTIRRKRKKQSTLTSQRKKRIVLRNCTPCSVLISENDAVLPHDLWRDSIFSSPKPNFSSSPDCHRPRLVVEHSSLEGSSLASFDPCLRRWFVIPTPSSLHFVAASGGLFCFVTKDGLPPSLLIGNPLTQRWRCLPEIPLSEFAHGPQILTMTADPVEGSFKVMALFGVWDDDASDAYLPFLYDSTVGSWETRRAVSARHSFCTSRSIVKLDDTLFSIDSAALKLLSYDITNNVASMKEFQNFASQFDHGDWQANSWARLPRIANCNGRLFLVARCLGERRRKCTVGKLPVVLHRSVGIWVMQPDFDAWEFITELSPDLLEQVVKGSDGTDFITASNGCNLIFFILKGSSIMLAYDTVSIDWIVLPGCPSDYRFEPFSQSAFYESLLWTASL